MRPLYVTLSEAREEIAELQKSRTAEQRVLLVRITGTDNYLTGTLMRGNALRRDAEIIAEY